MADRTVVITLKAEIAGYVSSMSAAAKSTKDFGVSAAASAAQHKQAWGEISKAPLIVGAALAALTIAASVAAAEFDAQMSVVKANVDDKSVPSMKRLADAALQAGRTMVFSATQAGEAENELAKAGLSAADITGGALTAALRLASAGQIDLGVAAEITASTMVQFSLKAKDAAHIADVLAAGADKSLGGVTDLGEALKYAGVPASQFGISLDTTVGVLAEFASNGILGSMAGTALRMMLIRLASPTSEASGEMKQLGLNFYDAQGKFKGVSDMAGQLHTKLSGLSDQQRQQTLVTLFGSRSLAEANILYRDGAEGVDKWTNAVNSQGFAAGQAATKMDNLNGDLTKLKNTLQVALIETGSAGTGPLRSLTQELTNVVNAYSSLPEPIKGAFLGIAGGTAVALLAVAGFITLAVKIGETARAFKELEIASKLSFMTGPLGFALGAATLAFGVFAKSQMDAAARSEEFRATLDATTGAITDQTHALVLKTLSDSGALASAKDMGISLGDVTNAALGNADALVRVNAALDAYARAASSNADGATEMSVGSAQQMDAMAKLRDVVNGTSAELTGAAAKSKDMAEASDLAAVAAGGQTAAQKLNGKAMTEQADAAKAATKANVELIKSMQDYASLLVAQHDSQVGYYSAIRAATQALKDNGKTLDITTEKGGKNVQALDAIGVASLKMVADTFKNRDANTELATAIASATDQVNQGRHAFILSAMGFGMSEAAANKLADQLGLTTDNVRTLSGTIENIPTEAKTTITAVTDVARTQLDAVNDRLDRINGRVSTATVNVNTNFIEHTVGDVTRSGQQMVLRAAGGYVSGSGTGTSDSINARLSNGEYVVNAAAVARFGRGFMDQVNSGQTPKGSSSGGAESSQMPTTLGNGATSSDIATQTRALTDAMGALVRMQQTMQRQMAGMR